MNINTEKPYLKRLFAGKNVYIFALVAVAFAALNIYRLNNPLNIGAQAPELILEMYNGKSFKMNEIMGAKVIIFYKKHTFFSNYIINTTYQRALSSFQILQDKGLAQVIVITQGYDTVEKLKTLLSDEEYSRYNNIMYTTDTKLAGQNYGVRSWPHLYVISSDNRVIYETKIGSADKVKQILWRD